MYAATHTVTLSGAVGHVVDVQVDVATGMVGTTMVGRPDTSIAEARGRCRSAIENSGHQWPTAKRVTILLSPADVPKRGSHFDLAIAMAVLAASCDEFPRDQLAGVLFIGELSLDGQLRGVSGVLPMAMAGAARGLTKVVVPEPQAAEASLVPGLEIYGVRSLSQAIAVLTGGEIPEAREVQPDSANSLLRWRGEGVAETHDLADLVGLHDARFALEVAAAGGHHLMLTGPKGSGKTSLAERLVTVLPDLAADEQLELTAVHSLAGSLKPGALLMSRPPFRAPHHSTSKSAIVGGGSGSVRPGEISKAHLGVLFLDEFPLLPRDIIEALRQPLESGEISIARGEESALFPAQAQVVLAANPCPCGEFHPARRDNSCICTEVRRRSYQAKLSGPIADRVDISRFVEPDFTSAVRVDPSQPPESSEVVGVRVCQARARQGHRYRGLGWRINARVPGSALRENFPLEDQATRLLDRMVRNGSLTQRGATRVHRVCWTLADLRDAERPDADDLAIAMALRTAQPLPLAALETYRGAA